MVPRTDIALRIEHIRLGWEFAVKEAEMHEHRAVQMLAVCATAVLAVAGSVVFEKVPPVPGMLFAGALLLVAAYVYAQLRALPRRLRRSPVTAREAVEMLMAADRE